jgi:two-component system, NtrC family, nitrogen regulation sensor histidine kinase NtrY
LGKRGIFLSAVFTLCAAGGMYTSYQAAQPVSPAFLAEQISRQLAVVLTAIEGEAERNKVSWNASSQLIHSTVTFLVIKNGELVAWSDNHFIPPLRSISENFKVRFLKFGAGEFLAKQWQIDQNTVLVSVIPLHVQYKISNDYIAPYWNKEIFHNHEVVVLEPEAPQGYVIEGDNAVAFRIFPIASVRTRTTFLNNASMALYSLASVLLVMLLYPYFSLLVKRNPAIGFVILTVSLLGARLLMIVLEFPAQFTDSPIFDPKYFASSEFNPSLGDLILNAIAVFVLCLYLLRHYTHFNVFQYRYKSKWAAWAMLIVAVLAVLFGMLYCFVVTQTIYNNSTLSFSISQTLEFDALRFLAFLTLVLTWISAFMFMHVFTRLLAAGKNLKQQLASAGVAVMLFVLINMASGQLFLSSLWVGLAYLAVVWVFKLYKSLSRFQFSTFAYFFVVVFFLSVNGVLATQHFELQRSIKEQFTFADNFLIDRDYFVEYLLQEASGRIANDVFVQTRLSNPLLSKEAIRQKISQVTLTGYFSRYSVKIMLFNSSGESLDDVGAVSFSDWVKVYDNESFKTEYDNVYYISNLSTDFSQKYVALIPVSRSGMHAGYVVIELSLKRVIPENVYPELLVDKRFQRNLQPQEYSYALLTGSDVKYSTGDFNYDKLNNSYFETNALFNTGIIRDRYVHVGVEDANGRIAIVSSPLFSRMSWLVNFSLQLLLGLGVILLFLFMQWIINFSNAQTLYLAARIQLILNLAFFVPLVVVSIITLSLTTRSSQEQLNEEFLVKAKRFGLVVANAVREFSNREAEEFESVFTNLTNQANVDANVFSLDGKMLASSQPLIFENYLQAPYINPGALRKINEGAKNFIANESVGNLDFYVAYSALFAPDTGEKIGVVGIPYYQSATSLARMQKTVLGNILTIFTLIFIALLLVSFLVTKWLTTPLSIVTKTLSRISLTGENTPLEWKTNDEIGLMIQEYNAMLSKLTRSKLELEQVQREQAWREIAQQVAHEIKNPLTPMKLTLQQLERIIEKEGNYDDKITKSVSSLLAQVNSLNDIASSFSTFAKMPEPVMEEVELITLLKRIIDLHVHEATITLESSLRNAQVRADAQLLSRIFSNIILNGIQAARTGVPPKIEVRVELLDGVYRTTISDNGAGIDVTLQDKIFMPHFTTKQSGSGLGLAIARQGIMQVGGKVYFETLPVGTAFIVELSAIEG